MNFSLSEVLYNKKCKIKNDLERDPLSNFAVMCNNLITILIVISIVMKILFPKCKIDFILKLIIPVILYLRNRVTSAEILLPSPLCSLDSG